MMVWHAVVKRRKRINADHVSPQLIANPPRKRFQIREIADPPVARRAKRIKLYTETPKSGVLLQCRRQVTRAFDGRTNGNGRVWKQRLQALQSLVRHLSADTESVDIIGVDSTGRCGTFAGICHFRCSRMATPCASRS